ncbi:MAG TPA: hypothetical protein PKZ68_09900, partial [Pseudomonadales bacterium]|nr:hypothetical protein [Pseudomonadales bacterium]
MSLSPMINPQFSGKSGEYVFDYDALMAFAESHSAGYRAAQPFPHIVVDDFVSEGISQQLQAGFPPADPALQERDNTSFVDEDTQRIPAQKNKVGIRNERLFDPFVRHLLWEMQSQAFILFLEKLTGIQNLLPDPRLLGGGTHQTLQGGLLRVHADFNIHRIYQLDRRLMQVALEVGVARPVGIGTLGDDSPLLQQALQNLVNVEALALFAAPL